MLSITLGNGIVQSESFNSRLQPTAIQAGSLLTLGYGYGTSVNNGNVLSQTIARNGSSWTQSYGYDTVNRLNAASELGAGSWSQNYGFDTFGNRWVSGSSGLPSPSNEVPNGSNWYLSNNRISGWGYDNAGNVTSILNMPRTYAYDAENRQTTATVNSVATTYAYDGAGQRVKKIWNSQTTTLVYDAFGNLAAEYGGPAGASGPQYLTTDHLGSTRLLTNSAGAAVTCYDYLPFGEEIGNGTAARTASCFGPGSYPAAGGAANVEFTGQARDAESGLDFFQARYMSAAQGRFMSPDPLGAFVADPGNPQSWNLYSYGLNNPPRYSDPTGYEPCVDGVDPDNGNLCTVATSTPIEPDPGPSITCYLYPWLCSGQSNPSTDPQQPPVQPPPLTKITTIAPSTGQKVACAADALLNLGISLSPYEEFAAAISLLGATSGHGFTPIEGMAGGSFFGSTDPATSAVDTVSNAGKLYARASFDAAGGAARLDRLKDLTTRAGFGLRSASAQARDLAALRSVSKAASVAKLLPVVGNAIAGAAAINDVHQCLSNP